MVPKHFHRLCSPAVPTRYVILCYADPHTHTLSLSLSVCLSLSLSLLKSSKKQSSVGFLLKRPKKIFPKLALSEVCPFISKYQVKAFLPFSCVCRVETTAFCSFHMRTRTPYARHKVHCAVHPYLVQKAISTWRERGVSMHCSFFFLSFHSPHSWTTWAFPHNTRTQIRIESIDFFLFWISTQMRRVINFHGWVVYCETSSICVSDKIEI